MIKYKYIDKRIPKLIFWIGSIFGMLLYSFTLWLNKHIIQDPLLEGLSYAGAVILGSSIAFTYGILFKVREGGK